MQGSRVHITKVVNSVNIGTEHPQRVHCKSNEADLSMVYSVEELIDLAETTFIRLSADSSRAENNEHTLHKADSAEALKRTDADLLRT